MTVELISVGTEILLGNIVNTNAAYLSEKCALLGLSCFHQKMGNPTLRCNFCCLYSVLDLSDNYNAGLSQTVTLLAKV